MSDESNGTLSGASQGASMGMSSGPWGAVAGAVVGGILGGFSAGKRARAENRRRSAFRGKLKQRYNENQVETARQRLAEDRINNLDKQANLVAADIQVGQEFTANATLANGLGDGSRFKRLSAGTQKTLDDHIKRSEYVQNELEIRRKRADAQDKSNFQDSFDAAKNVEHQSMGTAVGQSLLQAGIKYGSQYATDTINKQTQGSRAKAADETGKGGNNGYL